MADDKLSEYIKTELRKGFSIDEIKSTLKKTGWDETTIEKKMAAGAKKVGHPWIELHHKRLYVFIVFILLAIFITSYSFNLFGGGTVSEEPRTTHELGRISDEETVVVPSGEINVLQGKSYEIEVAFVNKCESTITVQAKAFCTDLDFEIDGGEAQTVRSGKSEKFLLRSLRNAPSAGSRAMCEVRFDNPDCGGYKQFMVQVN